MTQQQNRSLNTPSIGHRILHPHLEQVVEECQLMLTAGVNANLLLVCGPTGVGKTTLGHYLVEREKESCYQQILDDPGLIPAIRIEAPSSGEREFSWRDFFTRVIRELEGDLDLPRSASGLHPGTNVAARRTSPRSNRLSDLRTAVEHSLRARGTRVVVIDEAAHIMKQTNPRNLENQINTLKSLSNECNVQWVMLGSYDLFELMSLSGQLARRTHVTHFRRYLQSDEEDVRMFYGCIKGLSADISGLERLSLPRWGQILMENTLGCVGTLRTVLIRMSLLTSRHGWSDEQVERALLTRTQLDQITREIIEGEALIQPGIERSRETSAERFEGRKTRQSKKVA